MRSTGLLALLIPALLAACTRGPQHEEQALVRAANQALIHASRDEAKVDLANYQLTSLVRNANGQSDLLDPHFIGPDERALQAKLRGQRYWRLK